MLKMWRKPKVVQFGLFVWEAAATVDAVGDKSGGNVTGFSETDSI